MANYPAAGRVVTGFSHPVIGLYDGKGGVGSYTNGRVLARGVSVSLDIETAEDNEFYADNAVAESESGMFVAGTLTLEVDGLNPDTERIVMGLAEPSSETVGGIQIQISRTGADANAPYVGVGVLVEYKSGGTRIYVPVVFTKARFRQIGMNARTRQGEIDWQTQSLPVDLHRDDTDYHDWRWILGDYASESEAIAALDAVLGVAEG